MQCLQLILGKTNFYHCHQIANEFLSSILLTLVVEDRFSCGKYMAWLEPDWYYAR